MFPTCFTRQNGFHSRFVIKNHPFHQFSIAISCLSESFCTCWSVISMIFFWAKDHNVATSHCCGISSPECPFLKIGIQNFSIKIPLGIVVISFVVRYTALSFERNQKSDCCSIPRFSRRSDRIWSCKVVEERYQFSCCVLWSIWVEDWSELFFLNLAIKNPPVCWIWGQNLATFCAWSSGNNSFHK